MLNLLNLKFKYTLRFAVRVSVIVTPNNFKTISTRGFEKYYIHIGVLIERFPLTLVSSKKNAALAFPHTLLVGTLVYSRQNMSPELVWPFCGFYITRACLRLGLRADVVLKVRLRLRSDEFFEWWLVAAHDGTDWLRG